MAVIVRSRAPLRIGFAGGGTDVAPYCDTYGGAVLNATIDRYAYTTIQQREGIGIRFRSADQNLELSLQLDEPIELDGKFNLHKAVYNHFIDKYCGGRRLSVDITTHCDAPPGSGLGSSSTVVVSMIRAFVELLNVPLDDYAIADLAYRVERITCGLQGGLQDQYSATFGGVNFMEFYGDGRTVVNSLRIKNWILCELEASLILFFTGVSRESANIIKEQSSAVGANDSAALEALHGVKQEAVRMKDCLLKGDFGGITESMRRGWEHKKQSAKSISNSLIEEVYGRAIEAGALAGKVSGAGGGGFMLFYCPSESRMAVLRGLAGFGGLVSNAHFVKTGCQAWRVK